MRVDGRAAMRSIRRDRSCRGFRRTADRRHNYSIFSVRSDQLEVAFCHDNQHPRSINCSKIVAFRTVRGRSPGRSGGVASGDFCTVGARAGPIAPALRRCPPRGAKMPPKPGGWSNASNGTTRQSTAVGSIWRSPNSASYRLSALIAASPTNKPSSTKSPPGSRSEMPITPRPIGRCLYHLIN